MRRIPGALWSALLLAAPLAAQETKPPFTEPFRQLVEVRAIDLDVVATKGGTPVDDLTKEEVAIRVDGKPLPLDYFARVAEGTVHGPDLATASPELILETTKEDDGRRWVPRQFLVWFDDAHLRPPERLRVIEGLRDFFTRLTPSDRAALMAFGTTTRVLVPFTSSKEDLLDGLDKLQKIAPAGLRWESEYRMAVQQALRARRYSERRSVIDTWSEQDKARGKGMLEELRRAVAGLGARPGKRVLLFVSDGIELHPGQTLTQSLGPALSQWNLSLVDEFRTVLAEANRVGVTVDALDARGLVAEGDASASAPGPLSPFFESQNLLESLQGMADATGGVLVTNRNDFAPGLDRIYRDATTYYSVGVTLQNVDPRVKEHKVELTTTRPGVVLRTRRTVAARTPEEAARERMEMALLTPAAASDFPALLTLGPPRKGGGLGHRLLTWDLAVPTTSLTFRDESGKKVAPVEVSIAAVADTGERSAISTSRLQAAYVPVEGKEPPSWHLTGELKSGKGNFRFVATIRDLATDRVAVASSSIRVD